LFNASKHPDVILGTRSGQAVLNEFLETFEAHHQLSTTQARESLVTQAEFIDYYTSYSSSIQDDNEFVMILNNCWAPQDNKPSGNDNSWIPQKERSSPKKEFRKGHDDYTPASVYRSGMGSQDNPLNNTKDYYPSTQSASRGNMSGKMFQKPTFLPSEQDMIIDDQERDLTVKASIPKAVHAAYKR